MIKTIRVFIYIAALVVILPVHQVIAADTANATGIEKIDKAWEEVLKQANDLLARNLTNVDDGDPTERYNAYKNTMAMMIDMYKDTLYRSSSREHPEIVPYSTLITNSCDPSMSTRYFVSYIDPGASYRVWGIRGNPLDIDIQQWTSYAGIGEGHPVSADGAFASKTFSEQGIKFDQQGRFDFIISPTKPAKTTKNQWWKLENDTKVLMFRDVWDDYGKEVIPPTYHIEKIGAVRKGPTTLSPDEAAERLRYFAQGMNSMDICFKRRGVIPLHTFIQKIFAANPDDEQTSEMMSSKAMTKIPARSGQQKDQIYYLSQFNIKPGQAYVVEWTPPSYSLYWNIQLQTRSGQHFNYGDRQVGLTNKMTKVDKDGKVRFVISHEDPLVANWLDLDGNNRGHIWIRIKKGPAVDSPTAKLVDIDQVMDHLPKDTTMVTAEERQRQLDKLRWHYLTLYQRW